MSDISQTDIADLSPAVGYITQGYFDYAKEVISGRALADMRDGLKVVNRRILYTFSQSKSTGFVKGAKWSGDTMSYHPHSPDAIYDSGIQLTDLNGSCAFPLLKGQGNCGNKSTNKGHAAPRYTEAKLHQWALNEYFGEMNGIQMQPNYDSTLSEPEVLPVTFPAVLVNATSGIAVGFKSNIPSFNFTDVCNLVKEYIEKGACTTVIVPDFTTGGLYVKNDKELYRLMTTGSGKIKLRAKTLINDKEIHVTEIPYGKNIEGLIKQANATNISGLRNAYVTRDFNDSTLFIADCKTKASTESVLYQLFKDTDLQYTYSADMTCTYKGIPQKMGVWQIIKKWVEWRKEVILLDTNTRMDSLKVSAAQALAFMEVVNHTELKDELVTIVNKQGVDAGVKFILANFDKEIITPELAVWVCHRRLSDFNKGGKYADSYSKAMAEIKKLQQIVDAPEKEIYKQMDRLIATYGSKTPRHTEITDVDFEFVKDSETPVEKKRIRDTSYCRYEYKNGFLRKLYRASDDYDVEFAFDGTADDTLIAFDAEGHLLRVYCKDVPITDAYGAGTYLQNYFGFEDKDDFKINYIGRLDGRTLVLLYKDGNIGFVDTSEWLDVGRNVRVLERGISKASAPYLGHVFSIDSVKDLENCILLVSDTAGRLGWRLLSDVKQKDRTARTRAFTMFKDNLIDSYLLTDPIRITTILNGSSKYEGSMTKIGKGDFIGNAEDFVLI